MSMLTIKDYEDYSLHNLDTGTRDFLSLGAQNDVTLDANVNAFKQLRIRPRYMTDVSKRNLGISLFGCDIKAPICVSPTGVHNRFHANAELDTATGVKNFNTILTVSVNSTVTLEEISKNEPNLIKWFQVCIFKDRYITQDLVKRAEQSGYKAIVITVDFVVPGIRYYNERNQYQHYSGRVNFDKYNDAEVATDVTWNDLKWIREQTSLPIVVKGILTACDARLCVDCGADAVMVSNHGGRQLDDSPASLEALPEVVSEVGKEVEVYIDGGVRSGNDVFKALALGAKAVFIGRPILWGLVHSGSQGVESVLDLFYKELDTVMALSGCATVALLQLTILIDRTFNTSIATENYYRTLHLKLKIFAIEIKTIRKMFKYIY